MARASILGQLASVLRVTKYFYDIYHVLGDAAESASEKVLYSTSING